MTGKTERVILVRGDSSKWYEQAIFIVNPKAEKMPVDFVAEAEKIISDYNLNGETGKQKPPPAPMRPYKKSLDTSDIVLSLLMMAACIALAGIFIYGLLS